LSEISSIIGTAKLECILLGTSHGVLELGIFAPGNKVITIYIFNVKDLINNLHARHSVGQLDCKGKEGRVLVRWINIGDIALEWLVVSHQNDWEEMAKKNNKAELKP